MPISHEHKMQQGAPKQMPFTNPHDSGRNKSLCPGMQWRLRGPGGIQARPGTRVDIEACGEGSLGLERTR